MLEEYGKICGILLTSWRENWKKRCGDEGKESVEDLILPSNEDWRYRVYYRLVELQRVCDTDFIGRR